MQANSQLSGLGEALVAGVERSLSLSLRDRFDNIVTEAVAVLLFSSSTAALNTSLAWNGQLFAGQLVATRSGTYAYALMVDGSTFLEDVTSVVASSAETYSSDFHVSSHAVAGEVIETYTVLHDAFGNNASDVVAAAGQLCLATALLDTAVTVENCDPVDVILGQVVFLSLEITRAGSYTVYLSLRGESVLPVIGSPLHVSPGWVSETESSLSSNFTSGAAAGDLISTAAILRDSFGNLISEGITTRMDVTDSQETLRKSIDGSLASDGSFMFSTVITNAGAYSANIHVEDVTTGAEAVLSVGEGLVRAASLDLNASFIEVSSTSVTAGDPLLFAFIGRDKYENDGAYISPLTLKSSYDEEVIVMELSSESVVAYFNITFEIAREYVMNFKVQDKVLLTVNSTGATTPSLSVIVHPGSVSPLSVIDDTVMQAVYEAGTPLTVYVFPKDKFGNLIVRELSPGHLQLSTLSFPSAGAEFTTIDGGLSASSLILTITGRYTLQVSIGQSNEVVPSNLSIYVESSKSVATVVKSKTLS